MSMAVERKAISDVLARLATAIRDKDRAGLEALHDEDAVIFDLAPPLGKVFAAPPLVERQASRTRSSGSGFLWGRRMVPLLVS